MVLQQYYAVNIIPSGQAHQKLQELINQFATKYNSPVFKPHVTLLGDIPGAEKEMVYKTSVLSRQIEPFKVMLGEVGYESTYFNCLFFYCQENKELLEANSKARRIFSRENDSKFTPHVSIMYGYYPESLKGKIVNDIGKEFAIEFDVDSIHLWLSSSKTKPEEWRPIKSFDLI